MDLFPATATDPGIKYHPALRKLQLNGENTCTGVVQTENTEESQERFHIEASFTSYSPKYQMGLMPRSDPCHFLHFQEEGETETLERKDYFRYIRIYSRFE